MTLGIDALAPGRLPRKICNRSATVSSGEELGGLAMQEAL